MPSFFFRGRYADYARELNTKISKEYNPIFSTYVSIYMISASYGSIYGKFKEYDPEKDAIETTPAEVREEYFVSRPDYPVFRKIILISERQSKSNATERIDNALRYDIPINRSTPENLAKMSKYEENTKIIDGCALGGLELLYDKFKKLKDAEDIILEMEKIKKELEI